MHHFAARTLIRRSLVLTSAFFLSAQLAFAQTSDPFAPGGSGVFDTSNLGLYIVSAISFINNILVPLILALAFIVFIWGIYNGFIAGATNEEKRSDGQKLALYGVIGFVVIFSIWGIIHLLVGTFGFGGGTNPTPPTFNTGASSNSSQSPTIFSSSPSKTVSPSTNAAPPTTQPSASSASNLQTI